MYQNENLSVRVSDEFMQAALEGREWWTRAVTTGKPLEKKDARTLLQQDRRRHLDCGDPGLQFDGGHPEVAHVQGHRADSLDQSLLRVSCFLNNTACNLASLNLMKFKREDGSFDVERFKAAVRMFITAQEILVDNASYPTKEIAENSHIFRTLGLGYANLGSLIMSYGRSYDSNGGRALAGAITAIMTGHAYEQSARMARDRGRFTAIAIHVPRRAQAARKDNVESMLGVIQLHRCAVDQIPDAKEFAYLKQEAARTWDEAADVGNRHGYRNAQVTVLAPTGTISFLMDCDTTGIEPDIALVKYKLLAGGGMLKIVNQTIKPGLEKLGYASDEIERIVAHIDAFDTIEDVTDPDGTKVPVADEHGGRTATRCGRQQSSPPD